MQSIPILLLFNTATKSATPMIKEIELCFGAEVTKYWLHKRRLEKRVRIHRGETNGLSRRDHYA